MASPRPSSDDGSVDLSRLRIDRGADRGTVRSFPWGIVFVLLILGGMGYLFRDRIAGLIDDRGTPQVATVRALKVQPGETVEGDGAGKVASNGYIVADRSASLASILSGRLVELRVQEGDIVEENEVVARIQYDDLEADLARAKAELASVKERVQHADANLEAAKADLPRARADLEALGDLVDTAVARAEAADREVERNRHLYESKRIDGGTWDRVQTDARLARLAILVAKARVRESEAALAAREADVRAAEAALEVARSEVLTRDEIVALAQIQLDKTFIRSPFAGLVIRKDAEEGEIIAPMAAGNSRGSVVTIVAPASFEVQVELSEKRIARVSEGDTATVQLDADPDTGHRGRVRKIWPRADRSKGTIEVRVAFDEIPPLARPDMAARVTFDGEQAVSDAAIQEAYVRVPESAVVAKGDGRYVFEVEDGVARRRKVRLGRTLGGAVVIEDGLEGGERLVRDPPAGMADGDRIRTKEDA